MFQSSPSPKTGRYDRLHHKRIATYRWFQSSPSPKTGRYIRDSVWCYCIAFQSSPSPKTGRYIRSKSGVNNVCIVPILTQSENWALYHGTCSRPIQKLWFQSSPSPKTGRYSACTIWLARKHEFQSSPSPKTGRYPNSQYTQLRR